MTLLLKCIFYIAAIPNGLVGMFYLVMTVLSLLFPPLPHYQSWGGFFFALGCGVIVCLIALAYQLLIVQGKIGVGFGALAISYLLWLPLLLSLFIFGRGSWQ